MILAVNGGWAVHTPGATHCSFEEPTDFLCTQFCGGEAMGTQRELIRTLATAYLVWQAGLDPSGEDWVRQGGTEYDRLVGVGEIQTR